MLIPDVEIVFELGEERHELKFQDLPLHWWTDLKAQAGLTLKGLLDGIDEYDVSAFVSLIWLARRQGKASLSYQQVLRGLKPDVAFELVDFSVDGESQLPADDDADADGITTEGDDEDPPTGASESSS